MLWVNQLVEADDFLVELGTDTTDEQISKRRHPPKNDGWPVLEPSVGLGKQCENNIPFVHRLTSAIEYSGSSSE